MTVAGMIWAIQQARACAEEAKRQQTIADMHRQNLERSQMADGAVTMVLHDGVYVMPDHLGAPPTCLS